MADPMQPAPSPFPPKKTGGPKRTPAQREADLVLMQEWHVEGLTYRQIADKLVEIGRPYKLSFGMVRNELKKIEKLWREQAIDKVEHEKMRMLYGLKKQERELWAQWEASKKPKTRQTLTKTTGASGKEGAPAAPERETKQGVQESTTGNPAFMNMLLANYDRRAKLLGLDAPSKNEHTGKDGGAIITENLNLNAETPVEFTEEEQDALIARAVARVQKSNGQPTSTPEPGA
jgi:hypothetical protein